MFASENRYCRTSNLRAVISILFAVLFSGVTGCGPSNTSVDPPQTSQEHAGELQLDHIAVARRAIAAKDWVTAETELRSQLVENPDDVLALDMAGDVASARGKMQESARLYQAAVDKHPQASIELFDKLAQQWTVAGRLFESLSVLQDAINKYPSYPPFRLDLAGLGTLTGMEQLSIEQLKWLAQHNQGDGEGLMALAAPRRIQPDESICKEALERCPDDLRNHYPLARLDAANLQWLDVAQRLEGVVEQHRDFIPAQLLYGRALIELDRNDDVQQWHDQLPTSAQESADYWAVAGVWAEHQGNFEQAARAFGEAVKRDGSNDPETLKKLVVNLTRIGRGDASTRLTQRVQQFAELSDALDTFDWRDCESQSAAITVAQSMEKLGRLWEAEGWARLALSLSNDKTADAQAAYLAIRKKLSTDTPWQLPQGIIGNEINLEDLPQVAWTASRQPTIEMPLSQKQGDIRLEDESIPRGLIHTCEVSPQAKETGYAIFQTSGGGAAAVDFNLDGWPDLAVAMLDGDPMKSNSQPNQLYQNVAGQFENVTELAGMHDTGFAQGITVGDFNDDGFPDIFDANIGRNRLYRNNGDGTFSDVTDQVGLQGEFWTTSLVIADITGDGLADLFEVQYCAGEAPYTKQCPSSTDKDRIGSCSPLLFAAEPDRVWQGAADGRFAETTDHWLGQTSPGRGLGIAVGQFDENDGMDLYVANDMSANQFWSSTHHDGELRLTDLAVLRGLAVSGASKAQASMGIAAGDPDNDGDIDFFLTHFAREHNTFYQQESPGIWSDRSHRLGLGESSMNVMGFGTEWADFDNNGTVELIITNGHVNDVKEDDPHGITLAMPPQIYHRDRSGVWQELARQELGEYFSKPHVGRALLTLDANRDGRVDSLVTHLFEPVSLLINHTESAGASQGIVLVATSGQRDAIGAIVTLEVGGQKRTVQLLAGDGYMCSNQRRLSIGIGAATKIQNVHVHWPSGSHEVFGDILVGEDMLLIEGTGEPVRVR
ncbi:FG-GAP-like repeat-containing protein [Novipirellula sp. SH528]|uniref:FG-GAP-like repeat-containing protein n=1 Tax=Novipirellula sp. SH528 TaxID=3454466 RepID=UPI003F9F32B3